MLPDSTGVISKDIWKIRRNWGKKNEVGVMGGSKEDRTLCTTPQKQESTQQAQLQVAEMTAGDLSPDRR